MLIQQYYLYFASYRINIRNKFALLSMFCASARQTVDNALQLFLSTQYVTSKIISIEIFDAQMESLLKMWQTSTTNQENQLISDRSNFIFILNPMTNQASFIPNIFIVVIMSIIGFFRGISDGLKTIILIILRFIEKIPKGHGRFALIKSIKNILVCSDEQKKINRMQFILLVSALFIVFVIPFIKKEFIFIEIKNKNPSLSLYQNLSKDYSDSLHCPCSPLSIKNETFQPRINEICSSEFVYGEGNLSYSNVEHRCTINILTILIQLYGCFVIISRWLAGAIVKLSQNHIRPINS